MKKISSGFGGTFEAARSDARYELDMDQRVVKYVPENKALIEAAKEVIRAVAGDACAGNKILVAVGKLQKIVEGE